jgi:hypothetical protein
VTRTQQRLGLEVFEGVEPFDPSEVGVQQDPNHPVELPRRSPCLHAVEGGSQPLLEFPLEEEVPEVVEATERGGAGKVEALIEDSACLRSRSPVGSAHSLGTPFRDRGVLSQLSLYHGRSLPEPRQLSFFLDPRAPADIDLCEVSS